MPFYNGTAHHPLKIHPNPHHVLHPSGDDVGGGSAGLDTAHACTEPGCHHVFEDAQSLKDHLTQHTWGPHTIQVAPNGNKSFVCLSCGKSVTDRKVLRKHLLTHQEKRFLCSFDGCDKKFYERAKLKRHMLVHTGEKSFVCAFDGCGKQFAYKANLKTHLRTHTGLKPFACMVPGCNRMFAQASNRNSHMQTHNRPMAALSPPSSTPQPGIHRKNSGSPPVLQPQHFHQSVDDMHSLLDHVDSVMEDMALPTAFKAMPMLLPGPTTAPTVLPLPLQELLDEHPGSSMYQRIPTPPFVRDRPQQLPLKFKKTAANGEDLVAPLDLSMDGLKSSELYSMLPTPGSFIGNSVFSFEA
ncbi:hypothetical protein H310_01070 [Aphanomyces invadans]|uniref:C2H2-type domain-containing protein n=1 Tax=Aphanomyces invadans TaxID=157072 RepID=A0A024UQR1_9STRA|nr:hypothetical protein H310_01070 [Aphanomyces invadans]ETW08505.1 hypothetical protein H310_01070 [Aphanomyces invadans]|eukprot:XP_008862310.1 hypothetical protein H310_01070 [Aphanomyces invadans]